MNDRTKLFGATDAAKKKLKEGYKPFKKPKSGCTASGCAVTAKPGDKTPDGKQENGAR